MPESPIFVKTYDLLRWLVPKVTKFSRQYRFSLALPMLENAFTLERHLMQAAKIGQRSQVAHQLRMADVELALLRRKLRLSRDLNLLQLGSYEHASRLVDEIGRLLGGWLKRADMSGAKAP